MDRDQRIRDPIHDLIGFSHIEADDKMLWALLNTEPMQRLRRVRQLGFSEFVYPGATHTRLSHSLGAMQMARRMLDKFQGSLEASSTALDHASNRRSTLAAALLHDVGHGPYSHVFEELSEHFKIDRSHEEYTRDIIHDTEIHDILNEYDVFDPTIQFFSKEKAFTPYTTIISSQLDCDRLDFLARDRYFCGIRSSYIDFSWLFDSLYIEEILVDIDSGQNQFSFVFDKKGLRVVEEFVIAYMKMYSDVYFHKTTRSAQHLCVEMIKCAISDFSEHPSIKDHELVSFLCGRSNPNVSNYLRMDDHSVVSLIHILASGEFGRATELAKRYLRRDLFKCIEIRPTPEDEVPKNLISSFLRRLKEVEIFHRLDILSSRSYKQYDVSDKKFLENILIRSGGEHVRLHQISRLVRAIPGHVTRIYFDNAADKLRANEILSACRSAAGA